MNKTLEDLRREIDEIDHDLLKTLAKRMSAVKLVGEIKNLQGLDIVDEKRREELLQKVSDKAEALTLSKDFIKELFTKIHDHSVELQKKV
jgi:chorismate mutase